jgi:hypothetical protein
MAAMGSPSSSNPADSASPPPSCRGVRSRLTRSVAEITVAPSAAVGTEAIHERGDRRRDLPAAVGAGGGVVGGELDQTGA